MVSFDYFLSLPPIYNYSLPYAFPLTLIFDFCPLYLSPSNSLHIYFFLYYINCLWAIGSMVIFQTGKDLHLLCSLIQSEGLEWCLAFNTHEVYSCAWRRVVTIMTVYRIHNISPIIRYCPQVNNIFLVIIFN